MLVEAAAEHVGELRPRLERRESDVRSDEAVAVADKLQQFFLLRRLERDLAMPHEEDRVDVAETRAAAGGCAVGLLGRLRNDVRVSADEGVPHAGVVAEPLDD